MVLELETYSTTTLYSAMGVYAIAFIFYVIDLANRSGDAQRALTATEVPSKQSAVLGHAGTTLTLDRPRTASAVGGDSAGGSRGQSKSLRIAFALTVLGFVLHAAAVLLRGIAAERVPYANMYEFAITATLAIAAIFVVVRFFIDLRFLGALVIGLVLVFLGVAKVSFYVAITPLPPALDTYWLVIHITVAVLAMGFLTLSFGLSVLQLLQRRREARVAAGEVDALRFLRSFPSAVKLEDLAYRLTIIGFVFWTFTLIAGAIWAERTWSRYWGWDVKEVWTFVIWVLYAGFIHARATRGWRGVRSGWLNIIAYSAIIFNYTIVNLYFQGLHSYSGL